MGVRRGLHGRGFLDGRGLSIMGALWSLLFGRSVSVNGESYKVVRRIGEGGEAPIMSRAPFNPLCRFLLRGFGEREKWRAVCTGRHVSIMFKV